MSTDPNTPVPLPGSELMPLPGSTKKVLPGAHSTGPTHPEEVVAVTLRLRASASGTGADPKDMDEVVAWAAKAGLAVISTSVAERNVKLNGTVAVIEKAFGTKLDNYQMPPDEDHKAGYNFRGREGPLYLPPHLVIDDNGKPIIEGAFGLDDRPAARPHFRLKKKATIRPFAATSLGFLPRNLARIYNYPLDVTGKGQIVCILSLGGVIYPKDLALACAAANVPVPTINVVNIDGANPTSSDADGENSLDVQEIASIAPGATIYLLCAPNTDAGFLDAFTHAIHVRKATQVSCSWGSASVNWTTASMKAFDQEFQTAHTLGCEIFCSSGDDGSRDGTPNLATDFPADSPNVVSCGGTRTVMLTPPIPPLETGWGSPGDGASGGGYSMTFPRPPYQNGIVALAMRGVPDIAGNADPQTGDTIWINGQPQSIGGTSAVAPRSAALSALLNEKLGRNFAPWNPTLYANPSVFVDITSGNNGDYHCAPGWDAVTGLGRIDAAKLLAVLMASATPPAPVPTPIPQPIPPPLPWPPPSGLPTLTQDQWQALLHEKNRFLLSAVNLGGFGRLVVADMDALEKANTALTFNDLKTKGLIA